jgi:hypothetical protein
MSTICPNCLRPVRPGAKFCGFCGSSLIATTQEAGSVEQTATLTPGAGSQKPAIKPSATPKAGKGKRTALMVIITLLCLVLLIAFLFYYFQLIR